MWDDLKTLSIHAYIRDVVIVCRPGGRPSRSLRGFFFVAQETGTTVLTGVFFMPSEMELARSEVSFCVAGSVGHSEDVEGPATGSSG